MKYIISGIPLDESGVGRVLRYLEKEKCILIIPKNVKYSGNPSIKYNLLNDPLKLIRIFYIRFLNIFKFAYFNVKIRLIKDKDVVLIHPQSVGFRNALGIIKRNRVSLFIMDNSFFCRKSYNHIDHTYTACLKCLGGDFRHAYVEKCELSPSYQNTIHDFERFVEFLHFYKSRITFITQNKSQSELVKVNFGNDIMISELGLLTIDMFEEKEVSSYDDFKNTYDIVYHAAYQQAKGIKYFIELSLILNQYSFFVPYRKEFIENVIGKKILNSNIFFKECTWESDLKKYVCSAKLVMCPSLWSAPIEGALIKSILHNSNLASIASFYSFVNDIPDNLILKLKGDIAIDQIKIIEYINRKDKEENSYLWVKSLIKATEHKYREFFD